MLDVFIEWGEEDSHHFYNLIGVKCARLSYNMNIIIGFNSKCFLRKRKQKNFKISLLFGLVFFLDLFFIICY